MARFERIEVTGAQAVGFLLRTSRNYQATSLRHGIRPQRQQTDPYIEHREFRSSGSRVGHIVQARHSMCSVVLACTAISLERPNVPNEPRAAAT